MKMNDNFLGSLFGEEAVGVIGCSSRIFACLESLNEEFLSQMVDAMFDYAEISVSGLDNRFARYPTVFGNVMIYSKREPGGDLYTNIMFSDEVLL